MQKYFFFVIGVKREPQVLLSSPSDLATVDGTVIDSATTSVNLFICRKKQLIFNIFELLGIVSVKNALMFFPTHKAIDPTPHNLFPSSTDHLQSED